MRRQWQLCMVITRDVFWCDYMRHEKGNADNKTAERLLRKSMPISVSSTYFMFFRVGNTRI